MLARYTAYFVTGTLILSLAGCLGGSQPQPRNTSTPYGVAGPPPRRPGLTTKQKIVLLAGAAALAYMYNKSQKRKGVVGPQGQYYRSKNGRVYYRDAQGAAHWVSPPSGGIRVPQSEARQYLSDDEYQRYVGQSASPGY